MENKTEILIPDATYHVYNRANGSERLFLSEENYRFFLQKYKEYISPVADTFCYCLMPNHFHFLIKIKSEEELRKINLAKDLQGFKNLEGLRADEFEKQIAKQFSNFFNAYAKAFNKATNRKGSLFMHPFKRKRVSDQNYLYKLVHYIHYNPVNFTTCNLPEEWPHSSYPALIGNEQTFLERDEVISWFGDKDNFLHIHLGPEFETALN